DQEKWSEALAAARRAEALLQLGGGGDDLRHRVDEMLRDLEMVRRVEEARLRVLESHRDEHTDREGAQAAYAEAFAWYGLEPDRLDPGGAAEPLRSRPINVLLAAALDDWAYVRRLLGLPGWRWLLAVARAADPDPWRDRLRDALETDDPRALQELAASL